MVSVQEQLLQLCRGVVDLHVRDELVERLEAGKPLRIKAGFDPTRPDLHLGHTVLMEKMRQFQELGHQVVFIVGDFTAMVGDPTGRNEQRPRLTQEEVHAAAETYQNQAFMILDRDKTEVRYNSEWLGKLATSELIELGAKYTVARMLERDDFAKRYASNRPIHIHEFLYPLLQAYDSVVLECDVELGGTDQLFNLMVARDLMPRYGVKSQVVMTTPLLVGTGARVVDGQVVGAKMSKSADNYVALEDPPFEMLQKLMLIDDQALWHFTDLLSPRPAAELAERKREVEAGTTNVLELKEQFALDIVTRYHDAAAAQAALVRRRNISSGAAPTDIPEIAVEAQGEGIGLAKALQLAGLTKSTSEGMRLIKQGGVYLEQQRVQDSRLSLEKGKRYLVRVGGKNRRFAHLVVS